MNLTYAVGLIAASLILASQVPQVYKSFKLKQTKDLSLAMICLLIGGTLLWLLYGFLRPDIIIVLANFVMLVLLLMLLGLKLRYK